MKKSFIVILVIVIAVVGFGIYLSKAGSQKTSDNNLTSQNTTVAEQIKTVEFTLDAKRWEFTPNIITVKKGQKVKITINNTDTNHGINIPDLEVSGLDFVEFTADKAGEFAFACNTFCGEGHKDMTGKIIVTEN